MRKRAIALVAVACAACAPVKRGGSAPLSVETRVVVVQGRPSGELTIKTARDGTIETNLRIVKNGRGPTVAQAIRLAPDLTIASYRASGTYATGSELRETMTLADDKATWTSTAGTGEGHVTGAAFYIPNVDGPISPLLVPAALAAGGTIALLPGGKATVEYVAETSVASGAELRRLHCYRISGPWLEHRYSWFEAESGAWFAEVSPLQSYVPAGWESVVVSLLGKQRALDAQLFAKQAKQLAVRPKGGFAFTNARVLDVEAGEWIPNQTVVVAGDTIRAVGKTGSIKVPMGAETISAEGMSIVPGMIDMHAHLRPTAALLDIAAGVTTVRDVGNTPGETDPFVARLDAGAAIGPHVVRYGRIGDRDDKGATAVEGFAKRGYAGVMVDETVPPDEVPAIVKAARARRMEVTGDVPAGMTASEVIEAGFDGIEHIDMLLLQFFATKDTDTRGLARFTLVGDRAARLSFEADDVKRFIDLLATKKTVVTPTLYPFEELLLATPGAVLPGRETLAARLPLQVKRLDLRGGLAADDARRQQYEASWAKLLALIPVLVAAKVPVMVGTDSELGGIAFQHELALLVKAGLAPKDVLRMATLDAARALKLGRKIGSVAAGKRADLVVITGDPLAAIEDVRNTVYTVRGGVLYRADALYTAAGVAP